MLYLKEQDGNLNMFGIIIFLLKIISLILEFGIHSKKKKRDKFVNLKSSDLPMYCLRF